MSDGRRLRLLGALVASAVAVGALRLAGSLYPLSVHDALVSARLRLEGVRRVRYGSLSGIERSTCRPGGDCRCVALVHGLGDRAETWRRLLVDEDGARVGPGRRLVALDMPGTGDSPWPATDAGLAVPAQADALKGALAAACPRWTVVGNSLGGWTAAWLALKWPEGVERLVLLAPAGLKDPSGASEWTARTLAEPSVEVLKEFNRRVTHKERVLPERVFSEMASVLRGRPVRRLLEQVRPEHFLDGRLRGLGVPTAVLWGASDRVIPPSQAEAFRRELPGAELSVIPACGHLPQAECPEAVRRIL